jgi:AraC family transcriptional regulator
LRTVQKKTSSTQATYLQRVNLAIDYVFSHLGERLTLERVSRAASLSPFHFHRVFRAIVGVTLADFAKRLRLERALALMARSRRPSLTRIALACGFSSASDFSRCFKQRFGVPPSAFDVDAWRKSHLDELHAASGTSADRLHVDRLPARANPDRFKVKIRELPARTVAYIRVLDPYRGDAVVEAIGRLMRWAERRSFADNQWLGYQWDNPEITSLEDCVYHVAVEADGFAPQGEIGRFRFPPMLVAEVEVRGGIDLEIRALQWLFGSWLPASGYVPDDHPGFEAWIGRPFAHGMQHFEILAQVPVRRG